MIEIHILRDSMKRRSRLEVIFDVLRLLKGQGLPKARIVSGANVNHGILAEIIFGLFEKELVSSEIRDRSFSGFKRETEWFFLTPEGQEIVEDFEGLKSRITVTESQRGPGPG